MSADPFDSPQQGGQFDANALKGSLLLINVVSVEENIPTVHGETTAVKADIAVLDGTLRGETIVNTLIFPRVLVSKLRGSAGGKAVLARLTQGKAKPGQSPPWDLDEAVEADKVLAREHYKQTGPSEQPPF